MPINNFIPSLEQQWQERFRIIERNQQIFLKKAQTAPATPLATMAL